MMKNKLLLFLAYVIMTHIIYLPRNNYFLNSYSLVKYLIGFAMIIIAKRLMVKIIIYTKLKKARNNETNELTENNNINTCKQNTNK